MKHILAFRNTIMTQNIDLNKYFSDPKNFNVDNYIKLNEALGYKFKVREGLVIYGLIDEDIPSDVYFIPYKKKDGQSLKDLIIEALCDKQTIMLNMIFGHLSRTPGLSEMLKNVDSNQIYFEKIKRNAKVAYCRFVFNHYFGNFKSDYPTNPEIRSCNLIFNDKQYNVRTKYFSEEENGVPALFETISFY